MTNPETQLYNSTSTHLNPSGFFFLNIAQLRLQLRPARNKNQLNIFLEPLDTKFPIEPNLTFTWKNVF